jgi:hypothetical protein
VKSDSQCPGCGARNAPESRMCEWCGRAFLLRDRAHSGRSLRALGLSVGVLVSLLIATAAVLLGLGIIPSTGGPLTSPPAPPLPTTSIAPAADTADVAVPSDEATPEPTEYVRVTNTAGQGIILRREPGTTAARVAARAENTILQIVGPDAPADGRVWRPVQDAQGNRGWVPAEFLAPAPPPGA